MFKHIFLFFAGPQDLVLRFFRNLIFQSQIFSIFLFLASLCLPLADDSPEQLRTPFPTALDDHGGARAVARVWPGSDLDFLRGQPQCRVSFGPALHR